jgi:hypothetical protein
LDSVIIAMIPVVVLAGGIVSSVHRGRTRMWGLIAILLSIGVSIILYNFISLFPSWKNALLTTSACIILLVTLYLLLAMGGIRRNRPMNATLTQNMDREAVIPSSRTPVPISNCESSVLPNPARIVKGKKAASRVVLKQIPAAYAKKAQRSAAVEYTPITESDKLPHESPAEAVFPEPALPAENTSITTSNVQEWSDGEIAERICSSSMEDEAIKDEASEQLAKTQNDSAYIAPSAENTRSNDEAPGQSDETRAEPEYITSSAETRLVEYETLGLPAETRTVSEIFQSVESADLEKNPDQPTEQITSESLHSSFKDNMEEIIQLVSAKRYADAQADIFKMLSAGYTMTANDKQQLLLIMKLLKEKEKRADGATHTR